MSGEAAVGGPAECSQQYAVQVALVTMKERCQRLQERLVALERENAGLRAAAQSSASGGASAGEAELRDKVVQLQSQRSHLTHQVFIVASENKKLFDRLSRLTEANRSLGSHLSRISDTLNRHDTSASVDAVSASVDVVSGSAPSALALSRSLSPSDLSSVSLRPEPEGAGTAGERGAKEESLEEISSKLIQSILQAKADLQSQYEQMAELQSDEGPGFSYEAAAEDEAEEAARQLAERLAAARDALRSQQAQVRALLAALASRTERCRECEARRQQQEQERGELRSLQLWAGGSPQAAESHDISRVGPRPDSGAAGPPGDTASAVSRYTQCPPEDSAARPPQRERPEGESRQCEKLCPLCAKVYGPEHSFEEFQDHVMEHFPETDDDGEVTANFVVV